VGDGAFSRKSFDRIMDFKDAGKTILFCSHSMYQVEVLCDRVVWLENGSIREMGKPVEVITQYTELLRMAAPKEESISTTNQLEMENFQKELDEKKVKNIPSIRDIQVSADGVPGKVHKIDSEISNLEVNVIFDVGEGVPLVSVAVAISRGDGRIITSAGSVNDGITLTTNDSGQGVAKLLFPKLPLLRGNYFLDVALLCEKGIHLYESVRQAAEFNVEQKGLERGIVKLPHEWLD
jgi:lipopolysaccharide transport system ATP-binding protein